MADGTRTLLLTHALDAAQSERRRNANRSLSERARHDMAARAEVRQQLAGIALRHDAHVTHLGKHLRTELSPLADPPTGPPPNGWCATPSIRP